MRKDILEVVTIAFFALGLFAFLMAFLGTVRLPQRTVGEMFLMGAFHSAIGVFFLRSMKGSE